MAFQFSFSLLQRFRALCVLVLVLFCARLPAALPPVLNDAKAGAELAEKLRGMVPAENSEFRGAFEIERPGADDRMVPMLAAIVLTNGGWLSLYTAQTEQGPERLAIQHVPGKPSVYTHTVSGRAAVTSSGDTATNAFAGSDFASQDLGLEFLRWPGQVLLTREMRKGRGCHVLESRPAKAGMYSRVVSWIDEETSGVLMAEAYDHGGKLLKQFEVQKFKKAAGQWQVEEMELRNRQTKSSTRLRFQFGAK